MGPACPFGVGGGSPKRGRVRRKSDSLVLRVSLEWHAPNSRDGLQSSTKVGPSICRDLIRGQEPARYVEKARLDRPVTLDSRQEPLQYPVVELP